MSHFHDDVALIKTVNGICGYCRHTTTARLVAYFSGEIIIRCNYCRRAGKFEPDDKSYNDAKKFAPFLNDEDDER